VPACEAAGRARRSLRSDYSGTNVGDDWDGAHTDLIGSHEKMAGKTDKPIAALLEDLKKRGLLDSTSSSGAANSAERRFHKARTAGIITRTVFPCDGGSGNQRRAGDGRDRRVRRQAVDMRLDAHDVNATLLRLMGLDHEKLTYFYQGRDQRLTDVHGQNEFTKKLIG